MRNSIKYMINECLVILLSSKSDRAPPLDDEPPVVTFFGDPRVAGTVGATVTVAAVAADVVVGVETAGVTTVVGEALAGVGIEERLLLDCNDVVGTAFFACLAATVVVVEAGVGFVVINVPVVGPTDREIAAAGTSLFVAVRRGGIWLLKPIAK
jgi:hypothetical protein